MSTKATCWGLDDVDLCDGDCAEAFAMLPEGQADQIRGLSAWFLWRATGEQFGLCTRTYRPCRPVSSPGQGQLPSPARVNGDWYNLNCGSCRGGCGCEYVSRLDLPDVHSVVGVQVDGEDLDPAEVLVVYNRQHLVRTDGGVWPAYQDLGSVDGPGTWSVTVETGSPIPPGGAMVAGILACEMAKACIGDSSCRLPRRTQLVTRQGVTVGFQDLFENLDQLRVGLWEVDSFIESSRYTEDRQPSILSVDVPKPWVQTWPSQGV